MRTAYNGSVEGSYGSLPYGDGQTSSGSDTDANHVAMLDFDTESGTDHAQYRQYSPTEGRWLRPDPYAGSYDSSNPQSMNRYVYASNSPLSKIDPSGQMDTCSCDEDGGDWGLSGGGGDFGGFGGDGFGGFGAMGAPPAPPPPQVPGSTIQVTGTDPGTYTCSGQGICVLAYQSDQFNIAAQQQMLYSAFGQQNPYGAGNKVGSSASSNPQQPQKPQPQKFDFWDYVENGTFCTDTVHAAEKAGWIGGGIFVVGTGLDATGIAVPVGVAMQTYGAGVMSTSATIGAAAQIGKALGACH